MNCQWTRNLAIAGCIIAWGTALPAQERNPASLVRDALDGPNVDRQRAALVLIPELGLKGLQAAETAAVVEKYLQKTSDEENKALAINAYGKLTPPSAPGSGLLATYLYDPSPRVRQAAGVALVDLITAATRDFGKPVIGTTAMPGAIAAIMGTAPAVVWLKTWVGSLNIEKQPWTRFAEDARNLMPLCSYALKDPSDEVRKSGAEGLRLFARVIVDALPDPSTSVADTKVIDPLEAKLKWIWLRPVFESLNSSVPFLKNALASSDLATRKTATQAAAAAAHARAMALATRRYPPDDIGLLTDETIPQDVLKKGTLVILPALAERLDDSSSDIRLIAIEGFEHQGIDGLPYLNAIIHASKNDNIFVRWVATRALGKLFAGATPEETSQIVAALSMRVVDTDIDVRTTALNAIAKAGAAGRPATATVLSIAAQGDPDQRVLAIKTLGQIDADRRQVMAVMPRILEARPAAVRRAAVAYLGKLGAGARPILPSIMPLLLDSDDEVRREAARAVLAIDSAFKDN